eukprot:1065794-Ditylum_brightwellii.AAC.1
MEDTSRTSTMSEAAEEVDFDVRKPPVTPVTQPSEDLLLIAPENLNQYNGEAIGKYYEVGVNIKYRSEFEMVNVETGIYHVLRWSVFKERS